MRLGPPERFVDSSPLVRDLSAAARAEVVRLRAALVLLTFVGLLALVDCGLVGSEVAVGAGLLAATGAVLAHQLRSTRAMVVRRLLAGGVLSVLFVAAVSVAVSSGRENDLAALAGCLAVSFHPFVQDRTRELGAGILVAALPITLAWTLGTELPLTGYSVLAAVLLVYAFVVLTDIRRATSARVQAGDFGGATRRLQRFRTVSLAVAVLVVAAAVAGSALTPPVPSDALRTFAWSGASVSGTPTGPREAITADSVIDLRNRGPLPDLPVYEVPSDSPRLWRDADAYIYDGHAWVDPLLQRDLNLGRLLVGPGEEFGDTRAFSGPVVGTERTDLVRSEEGYRTPAVAPGRPLQVDTDRSLEVTRGGEFYVGAGDVGGFEYEVRSAPLPTAVEAWQAEQQGAPLAPEEADRPADDELLGLPNQVPARVHELAAEVVGDASPAEAVVAVERFLRSAATYDQDSPVPPRGREIVDHFLFESRSGACEQFATAGVVLLRSAGVPARLATGYAGGEDRGDGRRTVRASDAHAWVEAWVPGAGWVSADPTAGSEPADSSADTFLGKAWDDLREWLAEHPVLAATIVVLVVLAVLLVVGQLRRRRFAAAARALRGTPAVVAFRRLQLRLGRRSVGPTETVGELRAKFGRDRELDDAFEVVQADLYAPRPVGRERSASAAQVLDHLGRD